MSTEYRFLRFEISGLATLIFLVLGANPFYFNLLIKILTDDFAQSITFLGGIFILSLPVGYVEHQYIVNKYRSHKKPRYVHNILKNFVLEKQNEYDGDSENRPFFNDFNDIQKCSFLSSLLDLVIYQKDSKFDPTLHDRISNRWSHFYARRAVGRLSPVISIVLNVIILFLSYLLNIDVKIIFNTILMSLLLWIFIFIICIFVIDSYSEKIWYEINYLETMIILANKKNIKKMIDEIIPYLIENPKYCKQELSYAMFFYKL